MEKRIYDVNETRGICTGSLNDSPLAGNSPSMNELRPAHQGTYYSGQEHLVQIPNLLGVDISAEAVQQLQGFYDTASRNRIQGTPLDQRDVSLVAEGHIEPNDRLMIVGFGVHRHLTGPQMMVLRGSRWGSGFLSLAGAIIGGVLYTQDNNMGACGAWIGALVALWPILETQIIDRFCKAPDPMLREQEFNPAPERQYQV
jgi:hypothetical protein